MVERLRAYRHVGFFCGLVDPELPRYVNVTVPRRLYSLSIQAEDEEHLMRVSVTSLAVLLALVAFGRGVTGMAQGADNVTSALPIAGTAEAATAPAIPPIPVPIADRTFVPAQAHVLNQTLASPVQVPTSTLAPAPVLSPALAEPAREQIGNPEMPQTPGVRANIGVPGTPIVGVAGIRSAVQWRYRWHNNWWYWTPENRWMYRSGNEWTFYEPAVTAAPDVRYSEQPAYYQTNPNGYVSGPYRYSTGYGSYFRPTYQGGYYGPVYQRSYYYGSDGYYGQRGISYGVGFGRGVRFRF